MVEKNYNSLFIQTYGVRSVAYNPVLAKISDSAIAGLFLSQMLYWYGKGRNNKEVYKSAREFREETMLTRSQQGSAIRIWKKLDILTVTVKSIPQTRFFKIDINKLQALLDSYIDKHSDLPEFQKLFTKNSELIRRISENNTESTLSLTENTSQNTSKSSAERLPGRHRAPPRINHWGKRENVDDDLEKVPF